MGMYCEVDLGVVAMRNGGKNLEAVPRPLLINALWSRHIPPPQKERDTWRHKEWPTPSDVFRCAIPIG